MKRHTVHLHIGTIPGRTLVFLAVFFLLLIVGIGEYVHLLRETRWDGESRFTMVWQQSVSPATTSASLGIFSLEPRTSRALYIRLPATTLLQVPYGYHQYPAGSVFPVGELDKIHGGGTLLRRSLERTFGVFLEGYVVTDRTYPPPFLSSEELFAFKRTWKFFPQTFSGGQVQSNLSPLTWYRLWKAVRHLRSDQIQFLDLEQTTVLTNMLFPDGSAGHAINLDVFDTIIGDHLYDTKVRTEAQTVEIVNASDANGIAAELARMMERLGAHVIVKSTAKQQRQEACLYAVGPGQPKSSALTKYLQMAIHCRAASDILFFPQQSDVRVIIGKEFTK